jgi:hypothetical protein
VITSISVFWTAIMMFNAFMIHQMFRNNWVYNRRIEWIDHNIYDFKAHAPSYGYMLWHFWVWDMKRFGFNKGDSSEPR